MSANGAKPSPEVLRQVDVDQLLTQRLDRDRVEARSRRIAFLGSLWQQRKLLFRMLAWSTAAALLIAFLIPSRYASTTRLMPPDPPQGQGMAMLASLAGRVGGSLSSLGGDLLGMKTSADLFTGVLASRAVQDDLINKFNLRHVYREKRWVDARKELTQRTDVSVDRKSGILTIQVTDHDPKRASAMADEYVAQLNKVVTLLNTSSAQRERIFLEGRLEQVKGDLETAEKDFSQFASKNAAIDIKEQGKAMVEAAATLEGQMIAAQTELQGLRQIYTDNNVRVRSAQARVGELKRQLQKLGGSPETETANAGNGSGNGSENSSGNSSENELYPSLRKLPLLGVKYADLFRRTKVEETIFEVLTQQYELAKVQEAKEVPSVKILDSPDVPEKKVYPPRLLIVFGGAVFGLVLGSGWVFLRDRWSGIDPEDPGKLLVLDMVRTVRPQLVYATQYKAGFFVRCKVFLARLRKGSASQDAKGETASYPADSGR